MQYLFDIKRGKTAAHIWMGDDTACHMLSTGGIRMANRTVHDKTYGKRVCLMCSNNYMRHQFLQRVQDERQ